MPANLARDAGTRIIARCGSEKTSYHLDLARHIGGEVKQLALFRNERNGRGAFAVALQFGNGAVGTLQLNSQRIWWRNYDRIEITGQTDRQHSG